MDTTNRPWANEPIKCPSCGGGHSHNQLKESKGTCPVTGAELVQGCELNGDQFLRIKEQKTKVN